MVKEKKKISLPLFIVVWLLLFIGSALAIMNFHEEVSMQAVHQKLYWVITGKVGEKPLLLQIPYSIGIGLGMILFFNHIFQKRFNEEPSPLEIEMFNYQQDLDQYVIMNKNKETSTMLIIVESIALIMVGLAGGLAVGIGFVAFLSVLGIIPRLTQLSKTAVMIPFYEWAVIFGTAGATWIGLRDISFTWFPLINGPSRSFMRSLRWHACRRAYRSAECLPDFIKKGRHGR